MSRGTRLGSLERALDDAITSLIALRVARAAATPHPEAGTATPTEPIARSALRMDEAAKALGISRAKCYDLVAKGLIPSLKLGKTRRVPVAALDAFLKANRMEDKR